MRSPRTNLPALLLLCTLGVTCARAELPIVADTPPQPLLALSGRIAQSLEFLGRPLPESVTNALDELAHLPHDENLARAIQMLLDPFCLAGVHINPEGRVKAQRGPAQALLMQEGWSVYLIKVHNEAGVKAPLSIESENAAPALHRSSGQPEPKPQNLLSIGQVQNRFLELVPYTRTPMSKELSGLPLEYVILQILTRETGPKEAALTFYAGQGSQDLGFRSTLPILFDCQPSVKVVLRVHDHDGKPTMGSFIIMDRKPRYGPEADLRKADYRSGLAEWRPWDSTDEPEARLIGIYPLPARRVALLDEYPDFFFHPQIYRADGEHVYLPPGQYEVRYGRGPEYLPKQRTITVPEGVPAHEEHFQLERWIHMARRGWYSGDHHVHAGGCSHYESPEAGVQPPAMMRQALGEDLNVSCVLTWGPCWYHQKTFFEGKVHALSQPKYLMRYDVEVSGFPSSHAGHVVLLRLKEDDYPGTTKIEDWPSYTLPILQWAKAQGGVVGYAHSGWGLQPIEPTSELPNYVMAKFDGIGANEYIVTVTHGACDFISAADTPVNHELNIWYHTLNCGYRTAISGETDFPCIYDERIGMGRSYARLGKKLDFDQFCEEIRKGAVYVSDGRSHLFDFRVDRAKFGEKNNELRLNAPKTVKVQINAAAWLPEKQDDEGARIQKSGAPYWHIERARIPGTRRVPLEIVLNGYPVARKEIEADGTPHPVSLEVPIARSSWIAARILPSSHTNPIYILVNDQPIRPSRRSAQWCRDAVDQCWKMKAPAIREAERPAAEAAYDHARAAYDAILAEAHPD